MNSDAKLDAAVILGLLLMLAGVLAALVFVNIPDKNQTLFAGLSGAIVGAGLTSYINNRWGSSKSSAAKDQLIADIAKGQGQ